jgi:hypothetical protein
MPQNPTETSYDVQVIHAGIHDTRHALMTHKLTGDSVNSSSILSAATAIFLLGAAASYAQTAPAQPSGATVAQAPVANSECLAAAEAVENSIFLRLQGEEEENSRQAARVHLYRAEWAAAHGNEAECREQIGWSKYFVE